MTSRTSNDESQRDSGLKPRVARNALPWEKRSHNHNPNGVVDRCRNRDATPLGLKSSMTTTQGSSFLATLGYVTQSLWDCRDRRKSRSVTQLSCGCKSKRAPNFNDRCP